MRETHSPYFNFQYCILLLIVSVLLIYRQVIQFDFISLDDNIFVYLNPHIRNGLTAAAVQWAWTADLLHASGNVEYWQPVTAISRILDVHFYGLNPAGHHLTNLLLHGANVLLLFWLLVRGTQTHLQSLVAALIFAVHPLSVEAVAWVTSRKDLLSAFFALWMFHAYIFYAQKKELRFYFYALIFFVFALLSKPVAICLPVLLLLFDFWPLERFENRKSFSGLLKEKIPFLTGSFLMLLIVLFLPYDPEAASTWSYGSTNTLWTYPLRFGEQLYRFLIPLNLSYYQSHAGQPVLEWLPVISTILVLLLMTVMTFALRKRLKALITGWLWFLCGLMPLMNSAWAANRFMYFPIIGLAIMIAWGLQGKSRLIGWLIGAWIALLSAVAFIQTSHWKNDFSLFPYVLKIDPDNTKAHYVLGMRYYEMGAWNEAFFHFKSAFEVLDEPGPKLRAGRLMVDTLGRMGQQAMADEYTQIIQKIKVKGN